MFIFAKGTKEIVVTAGAVVACLALMGFAARCIYLGGFGWIVALGIVSIVLAIFKGAKLGYNIARALFCFLVVSMGTFAIFPFTYMDFLGDNDAFWVFLLRTALFVAIGCIAFFSLGEHAKLRGIELVSQPRP